MRKWIFTFLLVPVLLSAQMGDGPFGGSAVVTPDSSWDIATVEKLVVTDSTRNEGPLRQKGASTFGATATPAVIGVDGNGTFADTLISLKIVKATGGFQTRGGNARGATASDGQSSRDAATQVASGTSSTISGGSKNTASGNYSAVSGGYNNLASGTYSGIAGGSNNSSSSDGAFVAGGQYNSSAGAVSLSSGKYAVASRYGECAKASDRFSSAGDAQRSEFILRDTTLSSQSDTLKLNGVDNSVAGKLTVDANTSYYFEGEVIGRCISTNFFNQVACYKIEGCFSRNGSNTTTLDWSAVVDKFEGSDLSGCAVTLGINDTDEQFAILVTGVTATTIRWVAELRCVIVGGASL